MRLLMFRTAPWRDRSPAPTAKLVGRTLRSLVPKLETKGLFQKGMIQKYLYRTFTKTIERR